MFVSEIKGYLSRKIKTPQNHSFIKRQIAPNNNIIYWRNHGKS